MDTFKKLRVFITAIVFLVALGVLGGFSNSAQAAEIGQRLTQPEEGWKRYDDRDFAIKYIGEWEEITQSSGYNTTGTGLKIGNLGGKFHFNFTGENLRLLVINTNNYTDKVKITINGNVEYFSHKGKVSALTGSVLVYEKIGLPKNTIHEVVVEHIQEGATSRHSIQLDAIDIDSDGYLISSDIESLELVGEVTNDVNSLSWNVIENATYNVKKAITAGGPYTTIANELTTNSYIDSDVEEGVTYYYVVTAVLNGVESENSNEVVLTREGEEPAPQPEPDGNAKLTLHLVDNQIKEYEVTLVEVDKFISWFDKRMSGTGQAYYVFELKHNITPYKAVKEFMVFDKIVWYEVKEY